MRQKLVIFAAAVRKRICFKRKILVNDIAKREIRPIKPVKKLIPRNILRVVMFFGSAESPRKINLLPFFRFKKYSRSSAASLHNGSYFPMIYGNVFHLYNLTAKFGNGSLHYQIPARD